MHFGTVFFFLGGGGGFGAIAANGSKTEKTLVQTRVKMVKKMRSAPLLLWILTQIFSSVNVPTV